MSTTPRGMSVQEAYRLYRDGLLLVNRRYQRKLVWTVEEKEKLIDSIVRGYPIPLLLLAERSGAGELGGYEIIDGMQRFNAIFTYIENAFPYNGAYFNVREFTRAKQAAEAGLFKEGPATAPRMEDEKCADLLDYQLAVTIYSSKGGADITDVFGRINANGRQLSPQEQRQAGVITPFSELVRTAAAQLRGDVSQDVLPLTQMPEISVEWRTNRQGYGVRAEETIWCKQGILSTQQLRDSEDEQILADLACSILLEEPIAYSKELLDRYYNAATVESRALETHLAAYGREKLTTELKSTFSVLQSIIDEADIGTLKQIMSPTAPGMKTSFYALFMVLFDRLVRRQQSPLSAKEIMSSIKDTASNLRTNRHYATTEDRQRNIDTLNGLVDRYFVSKEPPVLAHGPGLILDLENSLRRSKIESSRYECKQGAVTLAADRKLDTALLERVVNTICGIANLGPEAAGYVFFGVADSESDANRIKQIDGVSPATVGNRYVVGLEREAAALGSTLDNHIRRILSAIRESPLSEPLKSQCLASVDPICYKGHTVLRVTVPPQKELSFVGDDAYIRENSDTKKVNGQALLALSKKFAG